MAKEIHSRQGIRDIPEICKAKGIKFAIVAPGSRNAPLILAFTKYSDIQCLSITDERSAAYIALGIAQHTGEPVALICTSGTAVLNLAPAIAEAYYQELPLIVFTADRPHEWIDQADGQTIRQKNIFSNYCKASYELPVETLTSDDLWYTHRQVSQAIDYSMVEPRGPAHINVPLKEPLYIPLPENASSIKIISSNNPEYSASTDSFRIFAEEWKASPRKLIIVGVSSKNEEMQRVVSKLSTRNDVLVIAENLSNINGSHIITTPESFIAKMNNEESEHFVPDLLITVGNSVVSKKLKQFLRNHPNIRHWHIESFPRYTDTYKNLDTIVLAPPALFFNEMLKEPSTPGNYATYFHPKIQELSNARQQYAKIIEFSDFKIFNLLAESIPAGSALHLSNSTPIRYSQLFETRNDLTYFCNRGTSGIDGCLSTAIGSAIASGKPTVIITGDLAFIYDSNALWNKYAPSNFKIIVINNNGGNIFRMIDTSDEIREIMPYFETPHVVNIEHLVKAFGMEYFGASDLQTTASQIPSFFNATKPAVFEIKTDAATNTRVFKDYFRYLKQFAQA